MMTHESLPVERATLSMVGHVAAAVLGYIVPFLAPVVAVLLLYRGYDWWHSSDAARRRFAVLLFLLGAVMTGYSVLFVSGLVTDTTFVGGGAK
jgi:hypothetical protein